MPPTANTSCRAWTFTIHDYNDGIEASLKELNVDYLVYGHERGTRTQREHLQGYLYFANAKTFTAVKRLLPPQAHIEKAAADAQTNRRYCTKEDALGYIEKGTIPQPGRRNDMATIRARLVAGEPVLDVQFDCTSVQQLKYCELFANVLLRRQRAREVPAVFWLHGPTGTGKTRYAADAAPFAYWTVPGQLKWWDGYDGQKQVIIDDFRPSICTFDYLLRLLDRYPLVVEKKGSSVPMIADTFYITSPMSAEDTYCNVATGEEVAQLTRRITTTLAFPLSD